MLFVLLACADAPTVASDASAECDTATTDSAAPDPLDALSACTASTPGNRLDIPGACADGVCLGHTMAQADEAYGTPGYCLASGESALCFWGDGILGFMTDTDQDGTPDDGARVWVLDLLDPWDGTDPSGLGLGLGLGCFVDALGTPDRLEFIAVDGSLVPAAADWDATYLRVSDEQDADYAFIPDGRVEAIVFRNAIYQ